MKVIVILLLIFSVSACSRLPVHYDIAPLEQGDISKVIAEDRKALKKAIHNALCIADSDNASETKPLTGTDLANCNSKKAENMKVFVDRAITASDNLCQRFFDSQLQSDDYQDLNQSSWNIFGDSILAISGITGASQKSLSVGASVLGTGNAFMDSKKELLRLTKTLPLLFKKIAKVRSTLAQSVRADSSGKSFAENLGNIRQYHATCSRISVLDYINSSIDVARFSAGESEKERALKKAAREINKIVMGANFAMDNARLTALYAFEIFTPSDDNAFNEGTFAPLFSRFNEIKEEGGDNYSKLQQNLLIVAGILNLNEQIGSFLNNRQPDALGAVGSPIEKLRVEGIVANTSFALDDDTTISISID